MEHPLALVLSGGGSRAAYQVGILRAIAEFAPDLRFQIITGVSAGAINTVCLAANSAGLAAGAAALEGNWNRLTTDQVYRARPLKLARSTIRLLADALIGRRRGPPAFRGLLDMSPLRRFLETAVDLSGIQANLDRGTLRAAALSSTSYTTGWTVTFVQTAEDVPMWSRAQRMAMHARLTFDHVLASAAIPIVFPAVGIGPEFFGDGSVRQAAPLAPAIHLGGRRVLAIGMRAERGAAVPVQRELAEYPSAAEVFGLLFHAVFLDALDTDAERLERVNRTLELFPADSKHPEGLHGIDLLMLHPSRDLGVMARQYPVALSSLMAAVVRAMGGRRARASDFLSYMMFDPPYTTDLIQLGYEDARRQRERIEYFIAGEPITSGKSGS